MLGENVNRMLDSKTYIVPDQLQKTAILQFSHIVYIYNLSTDFNDV